MCPPILSGLGAILKKRVANSSYVLPELAGARQGTINATS